MDAVYLPFYKRAMVDDANKYEATVERVCAGTSKRCCRATDRSSRRCQTRGAHRKHLAL